MNSMRGGMPPREPRGMPPPLRGGNVSPLNGTAAAPHPPTVAGASGDSQSLSYRSWGAWWPRGAQWPQRPHGPDGRQRWRAGRLLLPRTAGIPGKPLWRERPAPRRRLAVPQPVSVPCSQRHRSSALAWRCCGHSCPVTTAVLCLGPPRRGL